MLLLADGSSLTDKGTMWATIAAALIALVALGFSIRAAGDASRQAKAAKQSAGAAKDQVKVARDQLAQDQSAFEAEIRPLIVDAPFRRDMRQAAPGDTDTNVWWSISLGAKNVKGAGTVGAVVELRNVGGAVAFIQAVRIDTGAIYKGRLDRKVVPAGETARFEYVIPEIEFEAADHFETAIKNGTAYVAILYTDLPGRQRLLTKMYIADERAFRLTPLPDKRQQLKVSKLDVYRCADDWTPEDRPFATTEWSADGH